jgi:uncharacterized membrane protein YbhN (UPF0104 family)
MLHDKGSSNKPMKQILLPLKPYLRWVILGGTLFFLATALKDHWQEVAAIRIAGSGWASLAIALLITLLAHTWAGWVWSWILQALQQPFGNWWGVQVYLKTNIAKYLPGNVWQYYGRIWAIRSAGGSLGAASLSVLLEPLLMAAAALIIALTGSQLGWGDVSPNPQTRGLQILGLCVVLLAVHPRFLNPLMQVASWLKGKPTEDSAFWIEHYPLLPLLGELGFLGLRGTGFLFTWLAISPLNPHQIPQLYTAFSFAWLLGLLIPGAPGGLGVFEATAIALLDRHFSAGVILSVVALFRLVSILAEATGAGLATLSERRWGQK